MKLFSISGGQDNCVNTIPFRTYLTGIFPPKREHYRLIPKLILLCFLLSTIPHSGYGRAIDISISGSVLNEQGQPVIGANILVKGTRSGTMTDVSGNFKLQVAGTPVVLVVSSVGYQSQEVNTGNRTQIQIVLKADEKALDEVVVIGYGKSTRKDLTGAVGQVAMAEMEKAPVKSFDDALAGRVAGVMVSSGDGQPGSNNNIVIRGGNSVTQSNAPLYVVDGFPIADLDFNTINPSDIESITVLKDASATAIYGARGANGVIIVTTKRGKRGNLQINYDAYYGIQQATKTIPLMDPYNFVKYQIELAKAKASTFDPTQVYLTGPNLTLDDYKKIKGLNFQDEIFRTAPMQNHSISLRGGNDKTTYSVSGNIFRQDGILINTGFKRNQGRVVIDQTINAKLKAGINLNYSNSLGYGDIPSSITRSQPSSSSMYNIWGYRPVTGNSDVDLLNDLFDPLSLSSDNSSVNPLVNAKNILRQNSNDNLLYNAYLEYAISDKWKLKITGGESRSTYRTEAFNNSRTNLGNTLMPAQVNGWIYNNSSNTWLNENTLTYTNTFAKDHNLVVLAGITAQGNRMSNRGFYASLVPNESLGLDGLDESTSISATSTSSAWKLASFLGRINYDFRSKYLITASIRSDGSSKFSQKKQWGYFPSAAVAWNIDQENFMKSIRSVSEAKIRAGYGVTGNNQIDNFAYLTQLNFGLGNGYSYNNATPSLGAAIKTIGNPDLMWESTTQLDVGLDLGLLNQRINLSIDYYRKKTSHLLLNAQMPYTTGVSSAFVNVGSTENKGLEISVKSAILKRRNFSWSANFNISFNTNKLLSLANGQNTLLSSVAQIYPTLYPYIARVGQPIGQMNGLIWEGVYQYSDFNQQADGTYVLKDGVPANGKARTSIQPGDIRYQDRNGDMNITSDDNTVIGRGLPKHIGGFTNTLTFRRFDLSVFFQWVYGNNIINSNRLFFEGNIRASTSLNQFASYEDRWSNENQTSRNFRSGGEGVPFYSTRLIEDGSFLRLKTISLGYNFSEKILRPIGISRLRAYASVQNVFTWTKYTGFDPEVSVAQSALTPGFDYAPYPRAMTVTAGINVAF
jgi:TonB-linked SusC/RagA family outer membrane protein